jgi:hypothetical protein
MALYDATTTVKEVGPIRSARPYFVEWAYGWRASYFHVGGSPDALSLIDQYGSGFLNIDEMHAGSSFWRAADRWAPHNTYTSQEKMTTTLARLGTETRSVSMGWRFMDAATTTERGTSQTITIPYGGSYSVAWRYDRRLGSYQRLQAGKVQKDADGSSIFADTVVVIKTDMRVLDEKGRLSLRTVGSGDAMINYDGKRVMARWHRGQGEPIQFIGVSGSEIPLVRGKIWIEVTTDDATFSGSGE